MTGHLLALTAVLLFSGSTLRAQTPAPATPPNCSAPEHRQFDFWLGEWTVTDSVGTRVLGQNSIKSEEAGCLVHERWTGGGSVANTGQSLNAYDRTTGKWGQDWVGSGGGVLHLRGGRVGAAMVMEQESSTASGGTLRQRITWTPKPDGRVRQLWENSTDGGKSWSIAFDGWYRRDR